MFKPEGVYAAMLTAFSDDGSINEEMMRQIVEFQIESGLHGLFPVSSVGESIHMSREEKVRLMEIVTDQNQGRVKITPGVGSSYPAESIYLAKKAKELGCDGVVAAPPYYYTLSQDMIETYYLTIADAVELPIILYNIPIFAEPLSREIVQRLADRENIVGMKDSSGSMVDFLHFFDILDRSNAGVNVLSGREEMLLPCLMMGGKGCMVGTAGILPEIMVGIYETWKQEKYDEARDLQRSILGLVRAMFSLSFPTGFKVTMEQRGFKMGPPKQPLSEAQRTQYPRVEAIIKQELAPLLKIIKEQKR